MIQHYRNLKLQTKLMISYLIIISIPMILIAVFLYGRVYNMIVADTIRSEQARSARTAPAIEEALKQLLSDFDAIRELPFYEQLFDADESSELARLAASPAAADFVSQVKTHLTASAGQTVKLYIDLPPDQIAELNQATNGMVESLASTQNTYWKGIFAGSGASSLHCPDFYLSNYEKEHYGNMAYITKNYLHLGQQYVLCYSALYYSSDLYLDILKDNLPFNGSVSYIINDRDAIIATTNPALSSTYYLNYEAIRDSFMSSNNFLQNEVLEEKFYAGMYNIKQTGWYMLVVIPSTPLIRTSQRLMLQYLLLFLISIAAALFLAVTLSRSITRRLKLVITQMAKVRTGAPIPLEESHVHDEIGELIDTYNYMCREMNHLLKEMQKAGEELRIAEFRSLQAQINPHFLYNTMDMINWMAVQNRTSEIAEAVQSLSRFYKLTLSRKESICTLAQEIEHASIYIRLQNMRFLDGITFVVDISDELLDYDIPRLTLQPIIENAVLHGIMEKEDKTGTIVLTGWKEGEHTIVLLLSDDGIGMEEEHLAKILTEKREGTKGSNIAVYNTHHRLQILYGDSYGLSYQSTPGQGTEVSIRLPVRKKDRSFPAEALVHITDNPHSPQYSGRSVLKSTLLEYNETLSGSTYRLENLPQAADQQPDIFHILSHFVTEPFPEHSHAYYEMSYCCKGSVINRINGENRIQDSGTLYILHPDTVHAIEPLEPDTILVNFVLPVKLFKQLGRIIGLSAVERDMLRGGCLYLSLEQKGHLQAMLSQIVQDYATGNYRSIDDLCLQMEAFFEQLAALPRSFYGPGERCRQVIGYLKEHYTHQTAGEMAGSLGEPLAALEDLIKAETGQTIDHFIGQARLLAALSLLKRPDLSIAEIASACGFTGAEQLTSEFELAFPFTIEEFRIQHREVSAVLPPF